MHELSMHLNRCKFGNSPLNTRSTSDCFVWGKKNRHLCKTWIGGRGEKQETRAHGNVKNILNQTFDSSRTGALFKVDRYISFRRLLMKYIGLLYNRSLLAYFSSKYNSRLKLWWVKIFLGNHLSDKGSFFIHFFKKVSTRRILLSDSRSTPLSSISSL